MLTARTGLALVASLLFGALGSCGMPSASFNPRALNMDVSGDILVTQGFATSSSDVERLGMTDDSASFAPRADFEWGGFQMTAAHSSTEHSGDGVADSALEFGGVVISDTEPVHTDFELGMTSLLMTWDLLPSETLELGLGFGATLLDLDATITSKTTPANKIDTDEQVPIPMLAGRVGVDLGRLDFGGLISGLSVDVDGNQATVIDFDLAINYELLDMGGELMGAITLGYKSFSMDVLYDDGSSGSVDLDMEFSGPYFGVTITI
ncbi:MAG: hypothetical protein P1V81_16275 [Planctomycetota bacterium]|nr:hypothetical protein [Planctomycetota bacterium]